MSDSRAETLSSISSSLFTDKRPYDEMCQEIAENFYPIRADFTAERSIGGDIAGNLSDAFPINSRETLGNSIDSMLRQGEWFEVGTGDEERDQRPANAIALKMATKALRRIVKDPRTMFDVATKEADHDWVAFGQPVLSWEESPQRTNLITRAWHPKDCAWMVDDSGKTNALHRKMNMQARNILQKFKTGKWTGRLHDDIKRCAEKEPTKKFPIVHILMPTEEIYGDDHKGMRRIRHGFISIYIDPTHREILNELGSKTFNYLAPRYRTLSNLPWGFSPAALNSLPDARMLQAMAIVILEQGEKAVDPPIVGSSDVFVRDINLYAGGFTMVDLQDGQDIRNAMQVVETSQGLNTGLQLKQDVRNLMAEAWLLNKLFLPSLREMTAYETDQRMQEFRRAALPFFNPIDSQYHSPLLEVGFEMAVNMGYIDAGIFPEELQDEDISFTFSSPLKDAEGQQVVANFKQSVEIIAAGAQADETISKLFDIRRATIDAVRGAGAEPEWIKDEEAQEREAAKGDQVNDLLQTANVLQTGSAAVADVSNAAMLAQQAGVA